MADIKVEKLDKKEIDRRGVLSWPVWEKGVSGFDWHYDTVEECYLLDGDVTVTTKDGQTVRFGKGDFVTFPSGLSCFWDIKVPVRKHYNFK